MLFGLAAEDLEISGLQKLDGHSTLYKDQLPNRWEQVPDRYRRIFGSKATYLTIRDFSSSPQRTSLEAEWDDMDWYLFRGEEIWIARTNKAHLTVRKVGARWILSEEAGRGEGDPWSVVSRIGKIAFDRPRAFSGVDIRPELLKQIVEEDSRGDRYIWWKNVENGIDGALRGALQRGSGFRARFDAVAKPTYARFESISLSKEVSISCRNGSISGRALTPSEIHRYFEEHILGHV